MKRLPLFTLSILVLLSLILSACQPAATAKVIRGQEDLSDKTVGAQIGTTGAIEVENIEGATLKTYDTYDLAFLDLANGQIDAVIADYPTALGFVAQNNEKLMVIGDVFTNESYGVAVCNQQPELLETINAGLAAVRKNGVADQLEKKWLVGDPAEQSFSVAKTENTGSGPLVSIATDATFPPFETVDEQTKDLTGYDVELMRAIAQETGLNFEFVNINFDPMLAGLAQCQYDAAIAAITITDERKQQFLFSEPYINAGQIVVINKANAPK